MKNRKKFISAVSALLLTVPFCVESVASAELVDDQWLWQNLLDDGLTEAGAAGVIGNLYAESNLLSENLQDSYESILGYNDRGYVFDVDNGYYYNFATDGAGFGLPQFTFEPRKQGFLDTVRYYGESIESKEMQYDYIMRELREDFPGVLNVLTSTDDVYEAASFFMRYYENPEDQSYSAIQKRTDFSYYYYNKYVNTYTPSVSYVPNTQSSMIGEQVMFTGTNHHISAWDDSNGSYCGSGLVRITDVCLGAPYSLHAISEDNSSDCWGWISPSEISYDTSSAVSAPVSEPVYAEPVNNSVPQTTTINIGDRMMFNGSTHHISAFDSTGGSYCTSGEVEITDIYYDGTYQYHAVGKNGCSCWGWVSVNDLSPIDGGSTVTYEPAPVVQQSRNIQIGSTVYFNGGGHYSWSDADSPAGFPPAGTAKVTDIVEGSAHPYHIIHSDGESWVYGYCDAATVELLY